MQATVFVLERPSSSTVAAATAAAGVGDSKTSSPLLLCQYTLGGGPAGCSAAVVTAEVAVRPRRCGR